MELTDMSASIILNDSSVGGVNNLSLDRMLTGFSPEMVRFLTEGMNLEAVISAINSDGGEITPRAELVFSPFRLCNDIKIVLLGQDPYISGEAHGLSFSSLAKKTPPSLRNIYNCLLYHGLIKRIPSCNDLTGWAKQGVLLLNMAATTRMKKSNAHASYWKEYTQRIIKKLNDRPRIIYMLFGNSAGNMEKIISSNHLVLKWGHPSPLNRVNQSDNPNKFTYCDAFVRANDDLISRGLPEIDWGDLEKIVATPAPKIGNYQDDFEEQPERSSSAYVDDTVTTPSNYEGAPFVDVGDDDPMTPSNNILWLFTDGGATKNGRVGCRSSWAYYMTDGIVTSRDYGLVDSKAIDGKVYSSSNNRGELTAMMRGFEGVLLSDFTCREMRIISDSTYAIGSVSVWVNNWLSDPEKYNINEKKNLDIIIPTKNLLDKLKERFVVSFQHVRSHKNAPEDDSSEEWFIWKGNEIVDAYCNVALST